MESLLEAMQILVRHRPSDFLIRIGFHAMQMLTLLQNTSARNQIAPQRINRIIADAQVRLNQDLGVDISVEEIARSFGVGYSYFRREFKRQTGYSPKQYRIEIRHRQTRDLLCNSGLTIKEISERLGYSSPYHLSIEFSKRMSVSPKKWRMLAQRGQDVSASENP